MEIGSDVFRFHFSESLWVRFVMLLSPLLGNSLLFPRERDGNACAAAMERKALIWSLLVDTRKGAPQRLPTFTEAPQMVSSLAQMTSVIKYGKFHDTVNF